MNRTFKATLLLFVCIIPVALINVGIQAVNNHNHAQWNAAATATAQSEAAATAQAQTQATAIAVGKINDRIHAQNLFYLLRDVNYECSWETNPEAGEKGKSPYIFKLTAKNSTAHTILDKVTMYVLIRDSGQNAIVDQWDKSFVANWPAEEQKQMIFEIANAMPEANRYALVYIVPQNWILRTKKHFPQATLTANTLKSSPYPFDTLYRPTPTPEDESEKESDSTTNQDGPSQEPTAETSTSDSTSSTASSTSSDSSSSSSDPRRVSGSGFSVVPPADFTWGALPNSANRFGWMDSNGAEFYVDSGYLGSKSAYEITENASNLNVKKYGDKYRAIQLSEKQLGSRPAARLIYEIDNDGKTSRVVVYRIKEGRYGFAIFGKASADNFENLFPAFEEAVASFDINPQTIPRPSSGY